MGTVAAEGAIVLTDLRSADGGLEELFLTLTEDSQRDDLPRRHAQRSPGMSTVATPAPLQLDISGTRRSR